jgi:hypothetical protein
MDFQAGSLQKASSLKIHKKDAVPIRARASDSSDDCHCEELRGTRQSNPITDIYQQEIQKTLFERVAFFYKC